MKNAFKTAYPTGDHNNVEPEYGICKLEHFAGLAMQARLLIVRLMGI
jgi:hypothetical protein